MNYILSNPEAFIIYMNTALLALAYFVIYPKFAKDEIKKLMYFDIGFSVIGLIIAGYFFWGKDIPFTIGFMNVGWVSFSIIMYALFETFLFIWYSKTYGVALRTVADEKAQEEKTESKNDEK